MKKCKEDDPKEFRTITVNGKDYWVDSEGRLVLKDGCYAVPADQN